MCHFAMFSPSERVERRRKSGETLLNQKQTFTTSRLRSAASFVRRMLPSENTTALQRPRRNEFVRLPIDEKQQERRTSSEEAVADPGLTVELDLSEDAVGFRGREEPLELLYRALQEQLPDPSAFSSPSDLEWDNIGLKPPSLEMQFSAGFYSRPRKNLSTVMISGASGTGKTSLVRLFALLQQSKILFGTGRFHVSQSETSFPHAVLILALRKVVLRILEFEPDLQQMLSNTLGDRLTTTQRACLKEIIPCSVDLWNDVKKSSNLNGGIRRSGQKHRFVFVGRDSKKDSSERDSSLHESSHNRSSSGEKRTRNNADDLDSTNFTFELSFITETLRLFIDALAALDRPLVLFLDDLQWAHGQALALISTLLREFRNNTHSFSTQTKTYDSPSTIHENEVSRPGEVPTRPNWATTSRKSINQQRKSLIFIGAFRYCHTNEDDDDDEEGIQSQRESGQEDLLLKGMTVAQRMEWFTNKFAPDDCVRTHLENLNYEFTHQLINSALRLDSERTRSLADIVYRKTNGNPHYVLRYLEMLHREKFLNYSFTMYQWQWNLNLIQAETNVTDNVVHSLSRNLERQPDDIQAILRLASCLGFYFDIATLREIVLREGILSNSRFLAKTLPHSETARKKDSSPRSSLLSRVCLDTSKYSTVMESSYASIQSQLSEHEKLGAAWLGYVLGRAEREGLIERASARQYKFSHDKIQRCLYESTPAGIFRDMLHLRIGRFVRDTYLADRDQDDSQSKNEKLYFAVEQLNMSSSHIEDVEERIGLIELNLEASNKASKYLTFLAAVRFLRKAESLVRGEDWNDRYDLCLKVLSFVAEVEHSCGNSPGTLHAVDVVLSKARNFEDKIRVILIKVNDFGVQGRLEEAIQEGFVALEHLGEPLPAKLGSFNALKDIFTTNKALKQLSKSELLNLPEMNDPYKVAAVKLLNSLSLFAWQAAEESLLTVIIIRLMNITLKHGQNQFTPFTFATFAMLLAAHNDTNTATEFGQLALEMLQKSKSLVALPRTHLIVYTFTNHIRQPLLNGVEPLLNAHRIGLESGELEYGSLAVSSYASLYVIFGLPLPNFSKDMRTISAQFRHFHQILAQAALVPWWQFGMNLMGECEDVLELTGEAMREEEFENHLSGQAPAMTLTFVRLMLFYIFDRMDLALEMYEKLMKEKQKRILSSTHFMYHFQHFYCGLLNLTMARNTGKQRFKRNAKVHLSCLSDLVSMGAVNCKPMVVILNAEELALAGKPEKVKETYDWAISRCARSGFIHLQAITCERAGLFMYEQGDTFWAGTYLSQALQTYEEWGAKAKVASLQSKCLNLGLSQAVEKFSSCTHPFTFSLKGRTRFKSTTLRLRASFRA